MLVALVGAARVVEHDLVIVHPGDPDARPMKQTLLEELDGDGQPLAYHIWVDSVICREKSCDVVLVKLTYDALGRYQRYEVKNGETLTKLDHELFTKSDHEKLQRILLDENSPLSEVTKEGLTGPKNANAGVDGVSGATVLTLSANVVVGAGYTCYDLWHWANGLLTDRIRGMSGAAFRTERLLQLVNSDDAAGVVFALEQLAERRAADETAIAAVLKGIAGGTVDEAKGALGYFESIADDDPAYFSHVSRMLSVGSEAQRIFLCEALKASKRTAPKIFWDQVAATLSALETHQGVHACLELLKAKVPANVVAQRQAAKLLDHQKFFIARRAFWYLKKQDLTDDLRRLVDAFEDKYWDRL